MHIRNWKKEILTIPNLLSVFRIALIPVYLNIYLDGAYGRAAAVLAVSCLTDLVDGKIGFLNLMVLCGLAPSNKQARQLVQQGGVFVNDEKMTDATFAVTEEMLKDGLKIRKGKKVFHKAVLA